MVKPTAARQLRQRLIRLGADATKPLRITPLCRATADRTTPRRFRTLGRLTTATSILLGAAAGVSAVSAYAYWQYSYARNAETLRGPLDFGPGWAIAGWITPLVVIFAMPFITALPALALAWMFVSVATFALPFIQLNQSAKASDPDLPANASWQHGRAPVALKGWTATLIVAALSQFSNAGISMLLFMFAGLGGILMIQRLAEHQRHAIKKAQERLADEYARVL